ncbi:hypothetical protein AK812_SmicGene8892 [Symbiodinium microadriaticum]|uniref:Uncharacterized protein n=1 Tax=Symbiodinium microadriaticum TaxID=2951 RepID=A0A1Q9EJR1_SYMMI|nr:hypothetical protein AK812_SmicGene8892 [Symbiodinium microadriaticum]CAE7225922.1 unnamed protein product [Symbiodinium sp. KB8]CAE7248584.1 unnamed protein product [Symbiodinium microadriaticum]
MASLWLRYVDLHGEEWIASQIYLQEVQLRQMVQDMGILQQRHNSLQMQISALMRNQRLLFQQLAQKSSPNKFRSTPMIIDLDELDACPKGIRAKPSTIGRCVTAHIVGARWIRRRSPLHLATLLWRLQHLRGDPHLTELHYAVATNAELGKMVEDLTGRRPPPRTSKTTLVSRIERASLGDMRKSSSAQVSEKAPKRGCRASISKGQLAQMRSVLKSEAPSLALRHSHKDLEKMWNRMGMIAMYPKMTGKETLISRMKATPKAEYSWGSFAPDTIVTTEDQDVDS